MKRWEEVRFLQRWKSFLLQKVKGVEGRVVGGGMPASNHVQAVLPAAHSAVSHVSVWCWLEAECHGSFGVRGWQARQREGRNGGGGGSASAMGPFSLCLPMPWRLRKVVWVAACRW